MSYNLYKRKKFVIFFVFLFIFSLNLFAQDTFLLYTYSQINDYVETKNVGQINSILIANKKSRDYGKIENYIIIKAREQLVLNDLDLAMNLCYIVIDNNLDNFEAAALYTSIERTKKAQKEKERVAQEKEQIESIKQAEVIQRDTQKIQKEYLTITNPASGQRVYLDQDVDDYYQSLTWGIGIGLADFSGLIEIPNVDVFYGIAALANVFYRSDSIHIGLDVFGTLALSSFSDLEFLPIKGAGNLNIAFPKLGKHFYYRFGGLALLTYLNENGGLPDLFISPTVGLGFRDVGTDSFHFNFIVDYHLAHLYEDFVLTSFTTNLNFFIRFADLKKADIGLIIGLEDSFFYTNAGIQNHAKVNLSIGVWNND